MDLENPKTFNEKLNYLKLNDRNHLSPIVADKVEVRDYVSDLIGDRYLIPLIGIYSNANQIQLNELPEKFVIKANHGSGFNLICNDKNILDWKSEKYIMDQWIKKNAYYFSREWQYFDIKPKLICEELLSKELNDYKIFCSNGKPSLIQVDHSRFTDHQRTLFDLNWNEKEIQIRYKKINKKISKPTQLEEMLMVAEKLSSKFLFCRIDLYEFDNKVYFGEITLYPGGGQEPFLNKDQDLKMGELINIELL